MFIERACCSLKRRNDQGLTPADLSDVFGYPSLANQLRLRENSIIQLEKASIVRLVIKKRNVKRSDASSQVNEQDFIDTSKSNHLQLQLQHQIQ